LYDRFNDESWDKDERPARTVFVLNNSLWDMFRETRFGNLEKVGRRGTALLPRRPALSPIAHCDSLSFESEKNTTGLEIS